MEGAHFQTNVSVASGGSDALWAGMIHDSGTSAGQMYAAEFWFEGASGASVGSGTAACINLIMNLDSSYSQSAGANCYIFVATPDALVENFIVFAGETVDGSGGCVVANAATDATQGIRINLAGATYYIMLTSCTD